MCKTRDSLPICTYNPVAAKYNLKPKFITSLKIIIIFLLNSFEISSVTILRLLCISHIIPHQSLFNFTLFRMQEFKLRAVDYHSSIRLYPIISIHYWYNKFNLNGKYVFLSS